MADYEHKGWIDDVATRHREDPELDYDAMIRARIQSRFERLVLTGQQDHEDRASGEGVEKVVIASLVAACCEKYVEQVAHRHDGAGYDIRYSPDQGATWRYAEVKRYTQNCIHLSRNEYAFAAATAR